MIGADVWVVGRGGLLGSALARRHPAGTFPSAPVPWRDEARAVPVLRDELERFLAQVPADAPWTVYWAAGAGSIGSAAERFGQETRVLAGFLDALGGRATPRGAFFFASSASVYGGSARPPFTESTPAAPVNPYAAAKREQEKLVDAVLDGRMPHVIGRISTLFGPGQDLTKGQGLVSQMCLRAARRQPVSVFVPIDTLRDYIQVDDAAEVITRFVRAARDSGDTGSRIRVVARGASLTIAQLASHVRAVGHRRIGLSQAAVAPRSAHVQDLRVRTEFEHELVGLAWSPLAAGIQAVQADIFRQLTRSDVSPWPPGGG